MPIHRVWVVRKVRQRTASQRTQTARISSGSLNSRKIQLSPRQNRRLRSQYHSPLKTPRRKCASCSHKSPRRVPPIAPLVLDSPPPSKAQYAALKREKDRQLALRLAAEEKVEKLTNVIHAVRKSAQYSRNAKSKALESNKNLTANVEGLRRELDESHRFRRAQEMHAEGDLRRERERTRRWRAKSDRYRKRHSFQSHAIQKRAQDATNQAAKCYLARKGVYTSATRRLIRDLVGLGCAVTAVANIMRCCAKAFNVALVGRLPSERTCSRAVEEGGIAAKMQIGHMMSNSDGELHTNALTWAASL